MTGKTMKKWDGLDEAIMGMVLTYQDGERVPVVVYSGDKIISILMKRDGMEWDDAMDFVDFNIEGAYTGKDTPMLMWPTLEDDE